MAIKITPNIFNIDQFERHETLDDTTMMYNRAQKFCAEYKSDISVESVNDFNYSSVVNLRMSMDDFFVLMKDFKLAKIAKQQESIRSQNEILKEEWAKYCVLESLVENGG